MRNCKGWGRDSDQNTNQKHKWSVLEIKHTQLNTDYMDGAQTDADKDQRKHPWSEKQQGRDAFFFTFTFFYSCSLISGHQWSSVLDPESLFSIMDIQTASEIP